MAEALGCAASILAVIQLAGTVTALGYNYIAGVKRATNDMQLLVDELIGLGKVLGAVRQFANANPKSMTINLINEPNGPLQGCSRELDKLRLKLQPKGGTRGFIENLKWPLKEQDTLQYISTLERHKSLFNFALTSDQISLSKVIEAYVENIDFMTREIAACTQDAAAAIEDLRNDVRSSFEAQSQRRQQEDKLLATEKHKKALDWLYPQPFDRKHHEISRRRQEKTGDWLLQTIIFQAWVMGQPRLLWGHGIPGAGKTFLSSRVTDYLLARALKKNFGVAYIYFEYQEQESQKPDTVLSCLIKQLALQIPGGVKKIVDTYESSKRPGFGDLYDILSEILKSFKRTFFILDALDECNEETQREELLPLFQRLCKDGASVLLTSRPHPEDIQQFVADCDSARIELSAQDEDIVRYIEAMIERKPRAKRLVSQGGFRDRIVSDLTECSNGMFLLVHFHITLLCQQTTAKQILKELDKIKSFTNEERPLDPTYDRAMENVRRQPRNCIELAIRVFTWLLKARRTLTVDELRTAVSVEDGLYELDDLDLPDQMTLLDVCAGLVTIDHDSGDIRLAHYTVQEYLVRNSVTPPNADLQVAAACITYLSFDLFAEGPCSDNRSIKDRFKSNPFLEYAVPQLSCHITKCNEILTTDIILRFLRKQGCVGSFVQCLYRFGEKPFLLKRCSPLLRCYPPLHAAAMIGHATAVQQLIAEGANLSSRDGIVKSRLGDYTSFAPRPGDNTMDEDGDTPLGLAAIGGHLRVAELLVENGAKISAKSCQLTPLVLSMRYGHASVTEFLLDRGAEKFELFAAGRDGHTPLIEASTRGFHALVKILLNYGADVSAASHGDRTALMFSVRNGDEAITKTLLDHGANPSAADKDGVTVILIGVYSGSMSLIKMLLDYGADPSPANNWGFTPLMFAARMGNEPMLKILLDYGADPLAITPNGVIPPVITDDIPGVLSMPISRINGLNEGVSTLIKDSEGCSALIFAVISRNEGSVKALLEGGADIATVEKNGHTAIGYAVINQYKSIVKLLLDYKADPSADNDGITLLMHAVNTNNKPIAKMLLDYGANILATDIRGNSALFYALMEKSTAMVQLLLDYKADPSTPNNDGYTPVMTAMYTQNCSIIKALLDHGGNTSTANKDGDTPLLFAVMNRLQPMVKLLLDHKADASTSNDGRTALMYAILNQEALTVKMLLDHGADISAADNCGRTTLMFALLKQNKILAEMLLDHGASVLTADNHKNSTLVCAIRQGASTPVVKMLIDRGANLSSANDEKGTALIYAVISGIDTTVKLLLEHGADTSAVNNEGNTALIYALLNGFDSITKILLKYKADPSAPGSDRYTPLMVAVLKQEDSIVKMLLDYGADTSAVEETGRTALMYATFKGNKAIIKMHLDRGANPLARNNEGHNSLMFAVKADESILKIFLDHGADLSCTDNKGYTPLHIAAHFGKLEQAKLLLDRGANPSALSKSKKTPLIVAKKEGHKEVVQLLEGFH